MTSLRGFVNNHPIWSVVIGLLISFTVIGQLAGSSGSTSPTSNGGETVAAPQTPEDTVCGMDPQALKSQAQAIDYKQLVKDPGSYQGAFAKFTGQILQIQQQGSDGILRLSVTNEGDGIWSPNDVVYVEYHKATQSVEGDVVTVYGMLNGTETYTSQANYQITIPDMVACGIGSIASPASTSSGTTPEKTSTAGSAPTPAPVPSTPAVPQAPAQPQTYTTPSGAVVNTSGNVVTAPPAPPASWHTVDTFSGSADTNTNDFAIQGSKWRIDWSFDFPTSNASYCQQYGCNMSVDIYQDDGTYVDQFLEEGQQPSNGIVYEYGKPTGNVYLQIIGGNVSWTLTVEDYY